MVFDGSQVEVSTFDVYDTTLRDGTQQEGINVSVQDKLAIAALLDELGVGFIEAVGQVPCQRIPNSLSEQTAS